MRASTEWIVGAFLVTFGLLAAACSSGEPEAEADPSAGGAPEVVRTDPFRFVGLFDAEPMEILDCLDQTPFPLAESPEVVSLLEMHQEMTPGMEPVEYILVDARVVGIEDGDDSRLDVRELYRVGVEGVGCPDPDAPEPSALFEAFGNEPFWRIDVDPDSLTLTRPDEPSIRVAHGGITGSMGAGWTVQTTVRGSEFTLSLLDDGCRDSMAGSWYHLAASVAWGDVTWSGCAWQPVDDV